MVAVPYNETVEGKSYALTSSYYKAAENPESEFGEEKRRPRVVQAWQRKTNPYMKSKADK